MPLKTSLSLQKIWVRMCWSRSRGYRIVLVLAVVYAVLRLALQMYVLLDPTSQEVAADLQTYLNAAHSIQLRQGLYPSGALVNINFYQYAPPFAFLFILFTWVSPLVAALLHTFFHIAAYALLYVYWGRIFQNLNMPRVGQMQAWLLPVWLIFTPFWGDLAYLNIYIPVALLATLLIHAVINERLGWAVLCLAALLLIKPQWAFPALLPLLLGRRRFFFKLIAGAAALYLGSFVLSLWVLGPAYALRQWQEYAALLSGMSQRFPFRTLQDGFIGYNHSLKQIMVFMLGPTPLADVLTTVLKVLILAPLAISAVRLVLRPLNKMAWVVPSLSLQLIFCLYLAAFLCLDIYWEVSLSVVVFAYLIAVSHAQLTRWLLWVVFLAYALVDLIQVIGYVAIGPSVLIQDAYVAVDPSIYLPLMTLLLLAFYVPLAAKVWQAAGHKTPLPLLDPAAA